MGQPGWAELLVKASGVSRGGKVPAISLLAPHTGFDLSPHEHRVEVVDNGERAREPQQT